MPLDDDRDLAVCRPGRRGRERRGAIRILPDISGFEVQRRLRRESDVTVILLNFLRARPDTLPAGSGTVMPSGRWA